MWIKRGVALGLCLLCIGFCVIQVFHVDTAMQYLVLSPTEAEQDPEKPAPTALSQLISRLESAAEDWQGTISAWALSSWNEEVALEGKNGKSATARLVGLYGNAATLPQQLARFGRLLYAEDLQRGDRVMLISEALAIALFRTGDPVDRIVTVGGTEYRVAGILRETRTVGDHDQYTAYVPLKALDQAGFQTGTLAVSARPIAGAGAASQFKASMQAWQPGGDLHLLSKERSRTLLPLRALAVVMGGCLAVCLWRFYKRLALSLYGDYRHRLQSQFAVQLFPRLAGYAALLLAAGAAYLLLLYGLVQFALAPVYIFPEWIPAVPVEWTDISSTFWSSQTAVNRAVELRSPELMTLRFYRGVLCGLCVIAAVLLAKYYGEWRGAQRAKQ